MRYIILFLSLCFHQVQAQITMELDTPTNNAKIFAPALVSTDLKQRDIAIAPDGNEIYFTVFNEGFDGNIYVMRKTGTEWSKPAVAPFSGKNEDLEPAFAPDGNRIYFSSRRNADNYDIYYVDRQGNGEWSEPKPMGAPINTAANEFYPSVSRDGTLYYTAKYTHGVGGEDIWFAEYRKGAWSTPAPVPVINTQFDEFNAFVDPDEEFIYFGSYGRPDGTGGGDIYFAQRDKGVWHAGEHLGSEVNTPALDYCPFVSWDGEYLFFTSQRAGTNKSDIYWLKR